MKRVFAIGAIICALTGCGTVQNFERGTEKAAPYGGVDIAAERLKHPSPDGDFMRVDGPPDWLNAADLVGSAVGDTLLLPVTIAMQVTHDINAYYFPPDKSPSNTGPAGGLPDKPPPVIVPARTPNP